MDSEESGVFDQCCQSNSKPSVHLFTVISDCYSQSPKPIVRSCVSSLPYLEMMPMMGAHLFISPPCVLPVRPFRYGASQAYWGSGHHLT